MRERKAREAALHRRRMLPQRREAMRGLMEQWDDWSGTCRVCGCPLTGRLAQLAAHKCEGTCP